jgi:hypothetical protein
VSPLHRLALKISHEQLAALREIQKRIGVTPSEQIRRAVDTYLRSQTVLTKKEVSKILKEEK